VAFNGFPGRASPAEPSSTAEYEDRTVEEEHRDREFQRLFNAASRLNRLADRHELLLVGRWATDEAELVFVGDRCVP